MAGKGEGRRAARKGTTTTTKTATRKRRRRLRRRRASPQQRRLNQREELDGCWRHTTGRTRCRPMAAIYSRLSLEHIHIQLATASNGPLNQIWISIVNLQSLSIFLYVRGTLSVQHGPYLIAHKLASNILVCCRWARTFTNRILVLNKIFKWSNLSIKKGHHQGRYWNVRKSGFRIF